MPTLFRGDRRGIIQPPDPQWALAVSLFVSASVEIHSSTRWREPAVFQPPFRISTICEPLSSEATRFDELWQLDGQAADAALGRLTRLATEVLGAPVALLFLCDDQGLARGASSGSLSGWTPEFEALLADELCQHVSSSDEPLRFPDGFGSLLSGSSAVQQPDMDAGLAVRLAGADERVYGALMVLDRDARKWTGRDLDLLRGIAATVTTEIEFREERRLSENALRQSEERYRSLFEDSRDAIYSTSSDGSFEEFNQSVLDVFGYSREELLGLRAQDFYVDPEDRRRFQDAVESAGAARDFEVRLRAKGGEVLNCLISSTIRRSHDGLVVGYQGVIHDITERKRTQQALYAAEERFRSLVEQSLVGIYIIRGGRFNYVNPRFAEIFGYSTREVLELDAATALISEMDRDRMVAEVDKRLIRARESVHLAFRGVRKSGELVELEFHGSRTEIDGSAAIIGTLVDVSQRVRAEAENARLAAFSRENPNPILECDAEGALLHVNPAARRVAGELGLADVHALLPENHSELVESCLRSGQGFRSVEVAVADKVFSWTYHPHLQSRAVHLFATDVTGRRVMEEQLRHDALHDSLTGLPNRMLFMERLAHSNLQAKRRSNYLFAVLFLDLDRFKVINDSLGHHVGDELLITVAKRLQTCLRTEDTVARFGGDEFAILLEDLVDISDATRVAERIQQALTVAVNLSGFDVFTSASIGIALSSSAYEKPEYLIRNADMAMYRAKSSGLALFEVFDRTMHSQALLRLQLETDLRRALKHEEFRVYYQPIVSLPTGEVVGFEALVRWDHPDRGWLAPGEFIQVAEETGLILPLGQWVLGEACRQLSLWRERLDNERLTVSVNLCAKQFAQPDLVEQITQVLDDHRLEPCALKLEITESILMVNAEMASDLIGRLKAIGVQIYLDDFGTGYSSLNYLHRLPLNALKIDQSFIGRMDADAQSSHLVRTIVSLASSIGLLVVGEGIETHSQLQALREMNCELGQGHLFAEPMAAAEIETFLAAHRPDRFRFKAAADAH